MSRFALRVWLPDRPGALGLVASRIGAVGGDVVGIDILERDGGQAIDELAIELADPNVVPLLLSEVCEVDGVAVESVRPLEGRVRDPGAGAIEAALELVEARDHRELFNALGCACHEDAAADWSAVVADPGGGLLFARGAVPSASWIAAFAGGARSASGDPTETGPVDVAWAALPAAGAVMAVGRDGRPFRAHERRRLAGLVAIADRCAMALGGAPGGDRSTLRQSGQGPAPGALDSRDPASVPPVRG